MKALGQTLLISLILLAAGRGAPAADFPHPEAPRTINYYLRLDVSEHLPQLARWDALVLGYQLLDTDPSFFTHVRQLNPDQLIFLYIDPVLMTAWPTGEPGDLEYDFWHGVDPSWYGYSDLGEVISYWGANINLNITRHCPEVEGQIYRDYFVEFCEERFYPYIESGLVDGIFLDEMSGGGYLWWDPLFDGTFDYDLDGYGDPPDSVEVWLIEGMKMFADSLAAGKPADSFVMGNNCKPMHTALDGKFYEGFPSFWEEDLVGTLMDQDAWNSLPGETDVTSVNGLWWDEADLRQFRYRFTASLLTDNYFSFDNTTEDHYQLTWYELFDFELGLPISLRYTLGETPLGHEDFEDGPSRLVQIGEHATGSLVTDPQWVLEGDTSFRIESDTSYEFPVLAEITPSGGWQANTDYTVSFRYRMLDAEWDVGRFFLKGWSRSGVPESQFGTLSSRPADGGCGIFRDTFHCLDHDDYVVFLRSQGNVDMIIDSLTVVEGVGGLWARDYENGVVVCNDSPVDQPLPYNSDWYMVNADQQVVHHPGWASGSDLLLPPQDGLVFATNLVAVPETPPAPGLGLDGPWPNPGNPAFQVILRGDEGLGGDLALYDLRGRLQAKLWHGSFPGGDLVLSFRAGQAPLPELPSGVYLLKARSGESVVTRKWVLLR